MIAAVGGTLLGTLGSGLAFFAAPGILGGMGIGVVTAMVKVSFAHYNIQPRLKLQFGWRHRGDHFRGGAFERMKARAQAGQDGATDEALDAKRKEETIKKESHRVREDVWMRA